MANNLYSLLIGINDYKGHDLYQCVSDVKKVESYLNTLEQEKYNFHSPELLLDAKATKTNVVEKISTTIESLKDGDVFLFYYSGHGTQETSNDRFIDEHNGRIQCLVCHPADGIEKALLADKELRYLFSKMKTKAHVIAIFDCCHSGGITRGELNNTSEKQIRRMSVHFKPRKAENFIFNEEVALEKFKTERFKDIFPDKNVITLSASGSKESSWEDGEGGVFTRNLIKILEQKDSTLNYNDVAKFTRLSIQSTTQEKQTPTIDVYGDQTYSQMTSWLNLHGNKFLNNNGSMSYNTVHGWQYSKGSLHGVQASDLIEIALPSGERISSPISQVKIDHTDVDVSQSDLDKLDQEKRYSVVDKPMFFKPLIFVNDLDGEENLAESIKDIIKENGLVQLTTEQDKSDFDVNIFNQGVYFSFNNDSYRPLNKFFSLIQARKSDETLLEELENKLKNGFVTIQNWHHYSHLEAYDDFDSIPVEIELSYDDGQNWMNIINGQKIIEPETQRYHFPGNLNYHKLLYKKYQIRITNLTSEGLFVTPIALFNGVLEISVPNNEEQSIEIDAGKSKTISNAVFIDHYMEIFNWEEECVNIKFIVNNHSDLNNELASILQSGFEKPYSMKGRKRGGLPSNEFQNQERNAIFSSKIILKNPTFNQITGQLAKQQDRFFDEELISPFLQRLYFDIDEDSIDLKLKTKPNSGQAEERGFKMWLGNTIDHHRRKRRFKRLRRKFPNKPVIVAEGDSWFLYPILVKDTIDHLMTEYPIRSLAWAGDTLENYKKSGALLKEVEKLDPKYVLISGGGNDIIGPDIVNILEAGVASGQEPKAYLNDKYDAQMKKLNDLYSYFFIEVSKYDSVENILVHGYDYLRTDHAAIVVKGGWVSKYMIEKGITDSSDRKRLVDFLINDFNKMISDLADSYAKVIYVKLLNTINGDEWYDEIHPNDDGYKKIANKFKVHLT